MKSLWAGLWCTVMAAGKAVTAAGRVWVGFCRFEAEAGVRFVHSLPKWMFLLQAVL